MAENKTLLGRVTPREKLDYEVVFADVVSAGKNVVNDGSSYRMIGGPSLEYSKAIENIAGKIIRNAEGRFQPVPSKKLIEIMSKELADYLGHNMGMGEIIGSPPPRTPNPQLDLPAIQETAPLIITAMQERVKKYNLGQQREAPAI